MQAVVTDDLNPYKPVFEQLGVGHKSLPCSTRGVHRTRQKVGGESTQRERRVELAQG